MMEDQTPYRLVKIDLVVFDRLVLEGKLKPEDYEYIKYGIVNEEYNDERWLKAREIYLKAKKEFNNETYRCRDENPVSGSD